MTIPIIGPPPPFLRFFLEPFLGHGSDFELDELDELDEHPPDFELFSELSELFELFELELDPPRFKLLKN